MDTVHATEEWRPVEGWPYEISSHGRVRRAALGAHTWAGRILKLRLDGNGYLRVDLNRSGETKRFWVGATVCAVFNGPKPSPDLQLRHLDGDKQNNVPTNLKWGTARENGADRIAHGTQPMGEDHHNVRLSDAEVAAFRSEYAEMRRGRARVPRGWLKALAERYGLSREGAWELAHSRYRRPEEA